MAEHPGGGVRPETSGDSNVCVGSCGNLPFSKNAKQVLKLMQQDNLVCGNRSCGNRSCTLFTTGGSPSAQNLLQQPGSSGLWQHRQEELKHPNPVQLSGGVDVALGDMRDLHVPPPTKSGSA